MVATPTTLTPFVAPKNWNPKAFFLLARVSLAVKKVLAMGLLLCQAVHPPLGQQSRKSFRKLLLKLMVSHAVTGSVKPVLAIMSRWFTTVRFIWVRLPENLTLFSGIEYGDMQLIAEAYDILKRGLGLNESEIADIFVKWNKGVLDSFLIEITANILKFKDDDGEPVVTKILDKAGQKGTGKWTAIAALDAGTAGV